VFLQHPPASAVSNLFIAPFSKDLWSALLAIWMVTLAFTFLVRLVKRRLKQEDQLDECLVDHGESFVWIIGVACQQGSLN